VKHSKYLRFREKMRNVKMWKIESITFAEKNQSIVEYPIVYEPKKNVLDEQLEFDT
jgi:hypothetical protein